MSDYPLLLDLAGRRVVMIGGGTVATRRVRGLLEARARGEVIAPRIGEELAALVRDGAITWRPESWRPEFFRSELLAGGERIWLVHAATDDPAANAAAAAEADRHGIWCVRADDHRASSAHTPAVARGSGAADGLTVAVGGGGDPRRAVAVRDAVAAALDSGLLPLRRTRDDARSPVAPGRVALVGGGPGRADLITVRGRQLLAAAEVVIADRLGPRDLLDELDDDVLIIDVGKEPNRHPVPQQRINELLVEHARAGRAVVRLKGGDPFVLGRGGEEAIFCAEHGIGVEVVPGISSATSVPAAAGIPVTHRGITGSFVVASAHRGAEDALHALRDAPSDATLVLLMGVSTLGRTADELIAAGRRPDTPVAMIESGWTPAQRTTVTTLEKAPLIAEQERVRAPAIIVIGEVVGVRGMLGDLA